MPESPLRNLTPQELEDYENDGVVCLRGMFPTPWIERMANAIDDAVANPGMLGKLVSIKAEKKNENFSGDLFLWKTNDAFYDFVYHSPASLIAQQVLKSKVVRHFYDQTFVKPAGCHVPTPWHHDVTFWPVDVNAGQLCSMWITFDPVDRNSSGLEFIKGSHRWEQHYKAITPNYDPYMANSDFADLPDIDANRDDYDLFCPDMQAGDLLLFNARIVHGSSSNYSTERPRRAFASRWCDDTVTFDDRTATMPLMWDHGLQDGDKVSGSLFPQILPQTIAVEGAKRAEGLEFPEPAVVEQRLQKIAEAMAQRA